MFNWSQFDKSIAICIIALIVTAFISIRICSMTETFNPLFSKIEKNDYKYDPKVADVDTETAAKDSQQNATDPNAPHITVGPIISPADGSCPNGTKPDHDGSCTGKPETTRISKTDYTDYESTYSAATAPSIGGPCPGGTQVNKDGLCPGIVENFISAGLVKVKEMFKSKEKFEPKAAAEKVFKTVSAAANDVMGNMKLSTIQKFAIHNAVERMTTGLVKKYSNSTASAVKKFSMDAYGNILKYVKPSTTVDNFTINGIRSGISNTLDRAPVLNAIAKRETVGFSTKMPGVSGLKRRKGLHEYFDASNDESASLASSTPDVVDYAKELESARHDAQGSFSSYENAFREDSEACQDTSRSSDNLFDTCYQPIEKVDKNKFSGRFDVSEIYSGTRPENECDDGSYIGFDGATSCYKKVAVDVHDKEMGYDQYSRYVSEPGKDSWNYCPNGEYLPEIDQCRSITDTIDYPRFQQALSSGVHLHQALFPGPLPLFK